MGTRLDSWRGWHQHLDKHKYFPSVGVWDVISNNHYVNVYTGILMILISTIVWISTLSFHAFLVRFLDIIRIFSQFRFDFKSSLEYCGGRARIFMRDIMKVTCSVTQELRQEALMMNALSVTRHTFVTRERSGGRPGGPELCWGEIQVVNVTITS